MRISDAGRRRRLRGGLAALALSAALPGPQSIAAPAIPAPPPARVVSMNLCTDQIALLLAAPGQLVSVTTLAADPALSPMAAEAAALPTNRGLAEEVYLLRPDLVLAGAYTDAATVALLRRLGVRVMVRPPAETIPAIRDDIVAVGAALGRAAQAAAVLAQFDADLAGLAPPPGPRGRAAVYDANGYSSGPATLAGTILAAAGWDNVAGALGIAVTAPLPLESLVLARPDRVVTGARWPGTSRAEAILDHPALAAAAPAAITATDRDWVCGTPHILRAIAALR